MAADRAWSATAVNRGVLVVAVVLPLLAFGPTLAQQGRGGSTTRVAVVLPAVLIGAAMAAFATVRVTVGREGVTAGCGPLGLPRRRFAMGDITDAWATDVDPLDYGGWGLRLGANGTAMVIRRGEALVLELLGGGRFTVTVDDAKHAATLVNGYRTLS